MSAPIDGSKIFDQFAAFEMQRDCAGMDNLFALMDIQDAVLVAREAMMRPNDKSPFLPLKATL